MHIITQVQKGYYIRTRKTGEILGTLTHHWAIGQNFPAEWREVQNDPSIEEAEIFSSSQRNRRADKRKILDRYTKRSVQQ